MEKKFKHQERRGLPGGPNEMFTYTTGVFSTDAFSTKGYKRNSPDVNNPYNIIPSGNITMEDVDFPVHGVDNLGNEQMMTPGNDYQFPGDMVFETPMAQKGYEVPKRQGVRKNPDGTESTHLMATETLDGKNWFSFPTLFQDPDGTWVDMSEQAKKDWKLVYEEAKKRGEVIDFGTDKETAIKFGEGSWKPKMKRGGSLLTKTMKCNSCGWSWKAADGGNDVSTCHKCGSQALPKAQGGVEVEDYAPFASKQAYEEYWTKNGGIPNEKKKAEPKVEKPWENIGSNYNEIFKEATRLLIEEKKKENKKNLSPEVAKMNEQSIAYREFMENKKIREEIEEYKKQRILEEQNINPSTGATYSQDIDNTRAATIQDIPEYKMPSKDEGSIDQYVEPEFREQALNYLANPMTTLGYLARGQDLPNFVQDKDNPIDNAMDVINPFAYLDYANKASKNLDSGEYSEAGFNFLAAIPFLPKGGKALKGLAKTGEYLTTQTALKNISKINPYRFKADPAMVYRGLGKEGLEDALQSGVFRPNQNVKPNIIGGFDLAKDFNTTQVGTYYSPNFNVADKYGKGFIAEVPRDAATFGKRYKGADWSLKTKDQIPIDKGRILEKNWWYGYKPVEVPKQLPGSPNAIEPIYRGVYINDEIRNLSKFKGKSDNEILDIMGTTIPGNTGTRRKKQLEQTLNFGRDYESALNHIGKNTDKSSFQTLGNTSDLESGKMYILKVQPDDLPFISAEQSRMLYKQTIDAWRKKNNAGFVLGDDASNINPELLKQFGDSPVYRTEGENVINGNFPQFVGVEDTKIGKLLESKEVTRQDYLDYTNIAFKGLAKTPTQLFGSPNVFKSEIDWRKWNKEIPENKALMQEYNAIEQQTKADGTWMKNPDGSEFKGTPEQFVQQNSENFKKAFPNPVLDNIGNIQTNYHGSPNKFTEFKENLDGVHVTGDKFGKGVYTTPKKGVADIYSTKQGGDGSLYELYLNKGKQKTLKKDFQKLADEIEVEFENKNISLSERNKSLNNIRREMLSEKRQLKIGTDSDYFKVGDTQVTPFSNYPKSMTGNNGMFDMTNPNIYKALAPLMGVSAVGAAALLQSEELPENKYGGSLPKAQFGIKPIDYTTFVDNVGPAKSDNTSYVTDAETQFKSSDEFAKEPIKEPVDNIENKYPIKTHTVKRGDNLSTIAKDNNTTVDALIKLNNISNPRLIFPNQVIKFPEGPNDKKVWQPVDEIAKKTKEINALSDEGIIMKGQNIINPSQRYIVLDKKNNKLKVYGAGKMISSMEVVTGGNSSDAQTVTKNYLENKNDLIEKQILAGVKPDGDWGPNTEKAFLENNINFKPVWKTAWEKGNKSTGAGVYKMSNTSPTSASYYGYAPSFNMTNDAGIEVSTAIHGTADKNRIAAFGNDDERKAKFKKLPFNEFWDEWMNATGFTSKDIKNTTYDEALNDLVVSDNRMSNGCINGQCKDVEALYSLGLPIGTPIYILPEDKGNNFELVDGKPILRMSRKNREAYDGKYKDERGNDQDGQGSNYSINTLTYKPIKANFDFDNFKDTYFNGGGSAELQNTTLPFIDALTENKKEIMLAAKIPGDVYNQIAKMTFGIYGAESHFGRVNSYMGDVMRGVNKKVLNSNASSPGVVRKYEGFDYTLGIGEGAKSNANSVGYTQVRFQHHPYVDGKPLRYNASGKALYKGEEYKGKPGKLVIINDLNSYEREALSKFGITTNKDFLDPKKAAIGTAVLLAVRYNQQLNPDQKKDIWKYLPKTWSTRDGYSTRVKNNSGHLDFDQLDKLEEGGEIDDFNMYKNYMEGNYTGGDMEKAAKQVYDKLNRVYYKEAKANNTSVPNYIMTNIISKSV